METNRRSFLKKSAFLSGLALFRGLPSFAVLPTSKILQGIEPSFEDDLVLAPGLSYDIIAKWQDRLNPSEQFGFNADYIAHQVLSPNEILMWVNHEYVNPVFIGGEERTLSNIDRERKEVGGSLMVLKRDQAGKWNMVEGHALNRRIDGATKIPFAYGRTIRGSSYGEGTLGNCAGGMTPWGTFLTCEENYQDFYGDREHGEEKIRHPKDSLSWHLHYNNPPEHYGWVVEIEPKTGKAQKHITLGRMAHECATCTQDKAGRVVVYTGDDKGNEHLYKFISESNDSFEKGVLYAAQVETGKWLPLDLELSPQLKKHFTNQQDVLIYARKAAKILGATPLDRPEDIEIHPHTGEVYVSLTNNVLRAVVHGSILKLKELAGPSGLTFQAETYLFGGKDSKISCPDNLAFDKKGNLWVCNDISGSVIGLPPYMSFRNNGLFVIPATGPMKGQAIQVASAPKDAELTGLNFTEDGKTLFLSVQHPGEKSKSLSKLTSHWPHGGIPRSSVVAIQGEFLEGLSYDK
jgi:uncharacterized protein